MTCQVCGASPAASVTFLTERGLVIRRRLERREGVLCRQCGLSVGRHMQNRTLLVGWWGLLSSLWNFTVIARNAIRLHRHAGLALPPQLPGQLDPRPSTWRRGGVRVTAVVLAVTIGIAVYQEVKQSQLLNPTVGRCVRLTPVLSGLSNVRQFTDVVDCADQHDGRVVSANANGSCPANTITIVTTRNGVVVRGSTACVDPSM